MTTTSCLRSASAQDALDRDGFVVLPGLARDDVEALRAIYARTHDGVGPGESRPDAEPWHRDLAPGPEFANDLEASFDRRDRIEQELAPFWSRYLATAFVDHRTIVSTFLVKWPGQVGHLPLHQDPTFVDEETSRAVTLWIALDDADPERGNGPLHVVPGSHRVADELRGTLTSSTFLAWIGEIWPRAVPVPVRAGDAVVLDARTVHGSPPNTGDTPRLAMCAPLAPSGTPLVHVVGVDDDRVAIFGVPDDFYRRTSPARLWADPPTPPPQAERRVRARRPFRPELGQVRAPVTPGSTPVPSPPA